MKYHTTTYSHEQSAKIGVLLTNLGTPDAPTPKALRRYLREFLSDPRVVEMPRWLWQIILNLFILTTRPKKSAAAYQTVWTEEGSPLLTISRQQLAAIRARLSSAYGEQVICELGMRYGSPSIGDGIKSLTEQGATRILVLPLYPQYSASTTGSTFDAVSDALTKYRWIPGLRFIDSYFAEPSFIDACARKIEQYWQQHGKPQKLIFSYHGLPKRYLLNGDPYHCQCHKTSRLIADKLGLDENHYITTFQSRFGKEEWLKPYTDATLKSLPAQGIKNVQVFCPGFSADCLETIEEIGEENKGYFLEAGGESYQYISALNDDPQHIAALSSLIEKNLQGWLDNKERSL